MVEAARSEGVEGRERRIWRALESVADPEIPVVNIVELGIVRQVRAGADGRLRVRITPTYSGCPATEVIARSIRDTLDQSGFADVLLETVLWPPWSSEWLSESGRHKLEAFGIAVEGSAASPVACPRCASHQVERISEFGSTPCKAHYRCGECLEPFDTFKCL